jgi:hypothetical protein
MGIDNQEYEALVLRYHYLIPRLQERYELSEDEVGELVVQLCYEVRKYLTVPRSYGIVKYLTDSLSSRARALHRNHEQATDQLDYLLIIDDGGVDALEVRITLEQLVQNSGLTRKQQVVMRQYIKGGCHTRNTAQALGRTHPDISIVTNNAYRKMREGAATAIRWDMLAVKRKHV